MNPGYLAMPCRFRIPTWTSNPERGIGTPTQIANPEHGIGTITLTSDPEPQIGTLSFKPDPDEKEKGQKEKRSFKLVHCFQIIITLW